MANLLQETISVMERYNKSPEDIDYINMPPEECFDKPYYEASNATYFNDNENEENAKQLIAWRLFSYLSQEPFYEYDDGYGGQEVPNICIIFRDKSWLSRGEYDGSEWWDYNHTPEIII